MKENGAPAGIRIRVLGSKGRDDGPDYTTGAQAHRGGRGLILIACRAAQPPHRTKRASDRQRTGQ